MADRAAVRAAMVAALREIFGDDEVDQALGSEPDDYLLELDSKTAEYLLVAAEVVVGSKLPTPTDLGREQFASLGLLIDVALKGMS